MPFLPAARSVLPSLYRLSRSGRPLLSPYTTVASQERSLTDGESAILSKLQEKFKPSRLDVEDVSGGCGTFYAITISSSAFVGLPTVQQHRLVNSTIKEEIAGIHGLQLKTIPETLS